MNVLILCDRSSIWGGKYAQRLADELTAKGHDARMRNEAEEGPADICFLLNWTEIVSSEYRANFKHTLVVHAAPLPKGRGWSPLTWQIIEGKSDVVVSLIEATDPVDSGDIYFQRTVSYRGDELFYELQHGIGLATISLCNEFVDAFSVGPVIGRKQEGEPTYYRRRNYLDSQIDANKTIAEQFDLLRTVHNESYPAFFMHRGRKYFLRIDTDAE